VSLFAVNLKDPAAVSSEAWDEALHLEDAYITQGGKRASGRPATGTPAFHGKGGISLGRVAQLQQPCSFLEDPSLHLAFH